MKKKLVNILDRVLWNLGLVRRVHYSNLQAAKNGQKYTLYALFKQLMAHIYRNAKFPKNARKNEEKLKTYARSIALTLNGGSNDVHPNTK